MFWPHTNKRLVARPFMLRWVPACIAEPKPSITISMKMPHATPNAVSAVRSLFERSTAQISYQLSRSKAPSIIDPSACEPG